MNNDILVLLGRVIFGAYFVMSGINHLKNHEALIAYAQSKKVPNASAAVIATGLIILLGGLGIVFNVYVQLSAVLIIVFLLGVTFKMHAYWADADPMQKMNDQINFYKNLALLGAALMFLG